ncbi:hypothetical protein BJ508DRAFT_329362 [Ascobolus immersus RN42]|uniref:Uncharacterized protein n=1 Tax=Ascobolus immersus RN42 TaxID=1160509 RepID=A0A3N4HWJ4_ASCIM|nr:hypothetical protein BJ508DRAFT_329362 [Ascobolus immersus RN42]
MLASRDFRSTHQALPCWLLETFAPPTKRSHAGFSRLSLYPPSSSMLASRDFRSTHQALSCWLLETFAPPTKLFHAGFSGLSLHPPSGSALIPTRDVALVSPGRGFANAVPCPSNAYLSATLWFPHLLDVSTPPGFLHLRHFHTSSISTPPAFPHLFDISTPPRHFYTSSISTPPQFLYLYGRFEWYGLSSWASPSEHGRGISSEETLGATDVMLVLAVGDSWSIGIGIGSDWTLGAPAEA